MKNKTYKVTKLERNRYSILTDDLDRCYLCARPKEHLHEVIFGKNRNNSMKYGLVIPVCFHCHEIIHNNSRIDSNLKAEAQKMFERTYPELNFLDIFKRNYL